ncbi:MAG: hypothetical protein NT030_06470 [Candidatus Saganbacteria bacterium]|nr:hypothetical protein [Candidatus Saganbacteria bacterium]
MALTGREKATILLSVLGAESSAKILRYLPEELADLIAAGVNNLPVPSKVALTMVLDEFSDFVSLPPSPRRTQLAEAKRPEVRPRFEARTPSEVVMNTPPRVLTTLLFRERPQTLAFFLSNVPQSIAQEILSALPEQRRDVEILLRDLKKTPFSEKIKDMVFETLSKKVSGV